MIKIARIGKGKRFLKIGKYNLNVHINFLWYDLWVGAYWDRENKYLYICPLPTLCIKIVLRKSLTDAELMQRLAAECVEMERIEELSDTELVKEVFESPSKVADNPLVVGLVDRVLPGWEDLQL